MNKALKNTIFYTIGSLAKAAASFVLLPIYANMLGTEQYGIYGILQPFSIILATFMTLATERSIYRLYYDYKNNKKKTEFFSTLFWTINIVSIVTIFLSIAFGKYIIPFLGDIDFSQVFIPVILYTYIMALINFCQIAIQTEENGSAYLKISMLYLVLYNIITLSMLYFYSKSINSLVYANLIANLIVFPYAFKFLYKKIKLVFNKQVLKSVIKYTSSMFLMIVFAWVLHTSDRLLIANRVSLSDAGVYSLAIKISTVVTLFSGAIFQSYTPYFYRIANTMSIVEAKIKLARINTIIAYIVCSIIIFVSIVSKPLIDCLFDSNYKMSFTYLSIILLSITISQTTGFFNVMIYQNKKTSSLSFITITAAILNWTLNYIFLPIYGTITAATVNIITSLILVGLTYILARRNYYISSSNILKIILISFIALGAVNSTYIYVSRVWLSVTIILFILLLWCYAPIKLQIVNIHTFNTIFNAVKSKIIISSKIF